MKFPNCVNAHVVRNCRKAFRMSNGIFILVAITYIISALLLTRFIYNITKSNFWLIRLIILSFTYAIVYGLGIIGGGGDPGFALPVPIVFAAYYADKNEIFNNAIIPLFLWWTVTFFGMSLFLLVRKIYRASIKT